MRTTLSKRTLLEAMDCLIGKTIWRVNAGEAAGWVINFEIGDKVRRQLTGNWRLDARAADRYVGQYAIMTECPWRIRKRSSILCGALDDDHDGGPMQTGLQHVLHKRIEAIKVFNPLLDLQICFQGGVVFETFCAGSSVDIIQYCFYCGDDKAYAVLPNGVVTLDTR